MHVILLKIVVDAIAIIIEHLFKSVCFLWTLSFFEHKIIFVKAIQFRNREGKGMELANFQDLNMQKMHFWDPISQNMAFSRPTYQKVSFSRTPYTKNAFLWPPHTKKAFFKTPYKIGRYETPHTMSPHTTLTKIKTPSYKNDQNW